MYGSTVRLVQGDAVALETGVAPKRSSGVSALMSRLRQEYPQESVTSEAVTETATPAPAPAAAPAAAPKQGGAFLSRCITLQAVGGALIVGLYLSGAASKPFESDSSFLCWAIVAMGLLGIACVFMQRWRDVNWIATHVVRIGLLGTVIGLIAAFAAAGGGASSDASEVKAMIGQVVSGMYVSLYATLLGIGVNLWLKINLRLLGNDHG
jgi:hypothetical protein